MSTILTDIIQIKTAEQLLSSYIESNRPEDGSFNMNVDNAMSMRANVRDQKKIMEKKKLFEINTMTEADIKLAGLTKTEQCVLMKRLEMRTNSFREVDEALGYESDGSSSYQIYLKAIKKIEKFLMLSDDEKVKCVLSPQQYEIYGLLSKGMSNKHIAHSVGCSEAIVRVSKKRIEEKLNPFYQLSK